MHFAGRRLGKGPRAHLSTHFEQDGFSQCPGLDWAQLVGELRPHNTPDPTCARDSRAQCQETHLWNPQAREKGPPPRGLQHPHVRPIGARGSERDSGSDTEAEKQEERHAGTQCENPSSAAP